MTCPRCGSPCFERVAHAHGHEIVETWCQSGHSSFVSARPFVPIVEPPMDPADVERIARMPKFPCGHVRYVLNIRQEGNRVVCKLCHPARLPYRRRRVPVLMPYKRRQREEHEEFA
jgi:hypothetical protein